MSLPKGPLQSWRCPFKVGEKIKWGEGCGTVEQRNSYGNGPFIIAFEPTEVPKDALVYPRSGPWIFTVKIGERGYFRQLYYKEVERA